jgi:Flp pilus assembly pilin Flp
LENRQPEELQEESMDEQEPNQSQGEPQGANPGGNSHYEEFRVAGEDLVEKIKELLHEGNIRRVIVKDENGTTLIEVPLTLGVVGVVLLPVWAALGAIAALAANLTVVVEKADA